MTDTVERPTGREAETITRVVVRFAGDSGDGMQLTGDRFTSVSATFGNDLSTLPEYPARSAPQRERSTVSRASRYRSATTTSPRPATSPAS
jgi:Pyruvate/2-oxoacid:ferredoxin oxidoreductase gamma subunit